jgi:hypothetical protein
MAIERPTALQSIDGSTARRVCRVWLFVLALFVVFPASCFFSVNYVPAYSAAFYIQEIGASVRLQFYWVWDEARDNGRYLTVSGPQGSIRHRLCGYDWAHWARTGIYLTADRKVAVLGPRYCDYLVSLTSREVARAWKMASENWMYLGAFDFVGYPRGSGERMLRFISAAEQGECIEMMSDERLPDWAVRNGARRRSCPLFRLPKKAS